jgi:hypothetical protein
MEGIKEAARILGAPLKPEVMRDRADLRDLPGSLSVVEYEELSRSLAGHGVGPEDRARLLSRYGKRLGDAYLEFVDAAPKKLIELETMIALDTEQAESLEDLMRRRLELEYTSGHGEEYLAMIGEVYTRMRPNVDVELEKQRYRERMREIDSLLGAASGL